MAAAALLALGAPLISSAASARPYTASGANCAEVAATWKHGVARVEGNGMSCAAAKHVVQYALNHGLLARSHRSGSFFALRRRHALGFTFTADPRDHTRFHARKGAARITFNVCWLNVDC